MNNPFNVLDRSLHLYENYLLEASAGTGKTFSIQNLVVRLLIEQNGAEEPLTIEKILVVTFTRAAARDLKARIRANIEQAVRHLESEVHQNEFSQLMIPDYLKACLERGEQAVSLAKKRLLQALFMFDQAQIFTIHSFCARMLKQFSLESDIGLQVSSTDEPIPKSELMALIRDFFRTEMRQEVYGSSQLEIYLKNDPHQKDLLKLIQSGHDFPFLPTFGMTLNQFNERMAHLKEMYSLTSNKMIEDFSRQAPLYRNFSKETKEATLEKVVRLAKLFDKKRWNAADLDQLILDGLPWTKALDPSLLKKEAISPEELNYPQLTYQLTNALQTLIEEAGDFSRILLRMANDCRSYLHRFQLEEERLSSDDFLRKMHAALEQPSFYHNVQANYRAAIVDEFQDTDPLQWKIFSRLFLAADKPWRGNLYLVGDPKQSIYSFRQADIYTYIAAAEAIGKRNCLSLDTNYRSTAPLVEALNLLFDERHLPRFIPLPKRESYLSCTSVKAAKESQAEPFDDTRGAVHFILADCNALKKPTLTDLENDIYFPFMVNEIHRLQKTNGLALKQVALLVRDRSQALRASEYFESQGIPCHSQRGTNLADSPALQGLTDILRAVLHPQDHGSVRAALASSLMGWTCEEIKNLASTEFHLLLIRKLRASLTEKGFPLFFQELLQINCKQYGKTLLEELLAREGGLEIYRDLQLIADIVIDHQYIEWSSPEGIIPFLDNFQLWEENEDERVKRFQDPSADGVRILTLHVSKGLEFDVVFALGLVNRNGIRDAFIPIESEGRTILTPISEDSESYLSYCEENDSEKMRQLYVALTRAKYQLYIPVALHFSSDKLKWGNASPMELYLSRLSQPPASYQQLYERIEQEGGQNLTGFIERIGKKHLISYSLHQEVACESSGNVQSGGACSLKAPSLVTVPGVPLWITSFTTLSLHVERAAIERSPLLSKAPSDYKCSEKSIHSLPANSETGLLIHAILEKISFKEFCHFKEAGEACELIRPYIQYTPFKEWELAIATLIFNALKTPLKQTATPFSLAMIEENQFYREMPFVYPYKKENGIEEIAFKEGLIKGVIDLLFYQDGFYYLVDWKTNWLGPQTEAYNLTSLKGAMQENAYFLQAEIYTEAVKRFLKLVEARPFEECFGGIYYLFLRGMEPAQTTGIFHFFNDMGFL